MVDFSKMTPRKPAPPVPDGVLEIPTGWEALRPLREESWFRELAVFLAEERGAGVVWPKAGEEFAALAAVPLEDVVGVVVAQDPYPHAAARGKAFDVRRGRPVPVSAAVMTEELVADGFRPPPPGVFDLSPWEAQGILLLNVTLTVRAGAPKSHAHRGWEEFTSAVVRAVRGRDASRWAAHWLADPHGTRTPPTPAVFLALGGWARDHLQGAASSLCVPSDVTVTAPHPAAREGQFRGSRPFSRFNLYLAQHDAPPVDWSLSPPPPAPPEVLAAVRDAVRALDAARKAVAGADLDGELSRLASSALETSRHAAVLAGLGLKHAAAKDARERLRDLSSAVRTYLRWLETAGVSGLPGGDRDRA